MPQIVDSNSIHLDRPVRQSQIVNAGSITLDAFSPEPAHFPIDFYVDTRVRDLEPEQQTRMRDGFTSVLSEVSRPFTDIGYGFGSGINRGLANISVNLDLMAKHYERQGAGQSEGLFARAAEEVDKNADYWKSEFERNGINAIDKLFYFLGEAAGGAIPGTADFLLQIASGLYIPYVTGEERAYQRHDSHPTIAGLLSAAETGTLGLLFRMIEPFNRYIKATVLGSTFGVMDAAESPPGERIEGFARGAGTGALLGLTSGSGRIGLRDVFPESVPRHPAVLQELLAEQDAIHARREEELRKPPPEAPKPPLGEETVPGPPTIPPTGEVPPAVPPAPVTVGKPGAPPPPPRRKARAPKAKAEPRTFISWIRSKGGMHDPSLPGEMKDFGMREQKVMVINKKTGRPVDELVQQAISDGWLPEGSTTSDFLDALRTDIAAIKSKGQRLPKRGGKVAEATMEQKIDAQLRQEEIKALTPEIEAAQRQEYLDSLVEKVRVLEPGIAVPVEQLSRDEQQYLLSQGVTFTVDRMGKPLIKYSDERRVQDLREKVTRAAEEKRVAKEFGGAADPLTRLYDAWQQVSEEKGMPNVPIADVIERAGMTFEEAAPLIDAQKATGGIITATEASWGMGDAATPERIKQATIFAKTRGGQELRFSDIRFDDAPTWEPPGAEEVAPTAVSRTYTPEIIRRSLPREMSEAEKDLVSSRMMRLSDEEIGKLLRANMEQIRRELAQKRLVESRGVGAPGELFPDEATGQQMLYSGGPDTTALFTPIVEATGIWGKLGKMMKDVRDYCTIDALPRLSRLGAHMAGREHASARIAVPRIIKNLLAKVFPDYDKTERGRRLINKFADILNKDNVLGGYDSFLQRAYDALSEGNEAGYDKWLAAAQKVLETHPLTEYDFDVRAAMGNAEFMDTVSRWQGNVVPFLDQLYNEMKHVDPNTPRDSRGRHLDSRINLLSVQNEPMWREAMSDDRTQLPEPSASTYRNPNVKPDPYDQMAHFTGTYSTDMNAILAAVVGRRWNEVTKIRFYDDLIQKGIGIEAERGQQPPEGYKRLPFRIPETDRNGKTRIVEKGMFVPKELVREIRDVLGTDLPLGQNWLGKFLTDVQLAQLADLCTHTKNIQTVVTRAHGAGSIWWDAVRKVPGIGQVDTIYQIAKTGREVLADTPQMRDEIDRMSRMGLVRPDFPLTGIQKITRGQQIIHAFDTAARVIMNRRFDVLVRRGWAVDTPENRVRFVEQVGEYNLRLMGPMMRTAAQAGLSPFIVAGRNFNRQGRWAVTGNPGLEAASTNASVYMRTMNLIGTGLLFTFPMLLNYLTTGKMTGRAGTPLGAWDLGLEPDEKGKHKVIDLLAWVGARRGMRAIGLDAFANGLLTGDNMNDMMGNALQDASQTVIHPWLGPGVAFVSKTLTGKQLDVRGKMTAEKVPEGGGMQMLENFREALESQNPLVYSVVRPLFQEMGLDQKMPKPYFEELRETFLKSPATMIGARDIEPPPTEMERLQKEITIEQLKLKRQTEREIGETTRERRARERRELRRALQD